MASLVSSSANILSMKVRDAVALGLVAWCAITPRALAVTPDSAPAAEAKSKNSTYTSDTYGFSFQYPSNWILKEGGRLKLDWGYLGPVGNALPHGVPVVFVALEIPYGTSEGFLDAFYLVQVRVDTRLTPSQCYQSSFAGLEAPGIRRDPPKGGKFPTGKIGSIEFTEAQDAEAAMGHQAVGRYYHVFRNGACYEFQLGVNGTWTNLNSDELEDQFSDLKNILATLRFYQPNREPGPKSNLR